jgi:hypothetical protein
MTDPAGKRGPGSVNRPAGSVHPVRSGGTTSWLAGDIIAEGVRAMNCDNYWSSRAQPRSRQGAASTRSPAKPVWLDAVEAPDEAAAIERARRNSSEITLGDLKCKWPHHVTLPAERMRDPVNCEVIFSRCRCPIGTPLTDSLPCDDRDFVVFCFSKPEDAEAFAERLGGVLKRSAQGWRGRRAANRHRALRSISGPKRHSSRRPSPHRSPASSQRSRCRRGTSRA